ncbi:hypothetical protein BGZ94_003304 [Podila epigama]|nr:hypothetical protein BGZ94_003304 [Podila epigama]
MTTSTSDASTLLQAKDNVHNLVYFPFHGLASCIRTVLVLGNEPYKFTDMVFKEWLVTKDKTPFGFVPLLREEKKDGQMLELAEIGIIEQFLAKRNGLLGKNEWEEYTIKMYAHSTHSMIAFLFQSIVPMAKNDRPIFTAKFKTSTLAQWIKHHERLLVANGSNGRYLGDELTLADIKTASVVEHLIHLYADEPPISEKLTPAIWAVKTTLESHPKYQQWRASEQYQQYSATNRAFFGF